MRRSTRISHGAARGTGGARRQKLEADEVEVLAGLRHGATLGTPLALLIRTATTRTDVGDELRPPEGEPSGKGTQPVTLPRPGHADLAGVLKYGHTDVRNALERASARHTASHVAGTVAKALLATIGISVAGRVLEIGGATGDEAMREATERGAGRSRHARRRRRGRRDRRSTGPGLVRGEGTRLDARLAAALMGIQAVKGVEIGDGLDLARMPRLGGTRRDRARPGTTNRAGGIEGGVSNGELIVIEGR